MRARTQSSLAALDPASSRAIIPMTRQGTVVEIDGAVGARLGDRDGEIVLVARAAAPEKVALLAETVPYDWAFYEDGADAGPVKWALFSKQVVPYCWPDETRMRWILAKHPTLPPPEPFGDMHTEIEYYANNSPPEHLSPAKNSGSSIELNFRDDNWNNDEWIRAQPASKSAELLFRLEHFLVFE